MTDKGITITAGNPTGEPAKWGSFKMLAGGDHRVLLEFHPDGSTSFRDADIDKIAETFWKCQDPAGALEAWRIGTPFTVHVGPKEGPTVILHPGGQASTKNYMGDDRAMRMWKAIAEAWPKPEAK